jgi:hypothetical protein
MRRKSVANPLKLHINNITQYEIDKLVQIFHAANALCLSNVPHPAASSLTVVPRNGIEMLQSFTSDFSNHIGDGKAANERAGRLLHDP